MWDEEDIGSGSAPAWRWRQRLFDTDAEEFGTNTDIHPTRMLNAHSVAGGVVFRGDYARIEGPPYDGGYIAQLWSEAGELVWTYNGVNSDHEPLDFASDDQGRVWMLASNPAPEGAYITVCRMGDDGSVAHSVSLAPLVSETVWLAGTQNFALAPDASVAIVACNSYNPDTGGDQVPTLVAIDLTDGTLLWLHTLDDVEYYDNERPRVALIPGTNSLIAAGSWRVDSEDSDNSHLVIRLDCAGSLSSAPTEAWRREFREADDGPNVRVLCVNSKCAVIAHSDDLHSLIAYDLEGEVLWSQDLPSGFWTQGVLSMALTEDHLCVSVYEFGLS